MIIKQITIPCTELDANMKQVSYVLHGMNDSVALWILMTLYRVSGQYVGM